MDFSTQKWREFSDKAIVHGRGCAGVLGGVLAEREGERRREWNGRGEKRQEERRGEKRDSRGRGQEERRGGQSPRAICDDCEKPKNGPLTQ